VQTAVPDFIALFCAAFEQGQFLKCTLSRPTTAAAEGLKNIYIRPVQLKKGLYLAFNHRYHNRDEVKNYDIQTAAAHLEKMLGVEWKHADWFGTDYDLILDFGIHNKPVLQQKKAQKTALPSTQHDRNKQRLLDPTAPWLHLLGITSAQGEVLKASYGKWAQINKYLEIIESLLREQALQTQPNITDMGSGKGYLTFALYDFLKNKLGLAPRIVGIELRQHLVDFCNRAAQEAGFEGLTFVAQDISTYQPPGLDMLIALHACDTATDLALATGIRLSAPIIVAAPCCHKQIRRDMKAQNELAPLLRYGILEERQAEILTDGIRALLLEAEGYQTKVFEFISTEHTAKNVMITALQGKKTIQKRADALEKVAALKAGFGISEHYLERLI
jgi:hypothetical protein